MNNLIPTKTRGQLIAIGFWFALLNALLGVLVSWRYAKYIDMDFNLFNWMYLALASLGHYSLLSLLLFGVVLVPITLVLPKRGVVAFVSVLLMTVSIFVLVIDTFVFDLYRFHINAFVLQMIFGSGASQVFVFDTILYIKAIAFVLVVIIVEIFAYWGVSKLHSNGKLRRAWIALVAVLFCNISYNAIHVWASAYYYRPVVQSSRFYPLSYPLTANSFLYKHHIVDAAGARDRIDASGGDSHDLCYPVHPLVGDSLKEPYNILFILIDSWNHRTFCPESTPNIASFADSSLVFTNHLSGSNGTRGGVFTLFYSLPALYWYDVEALQLSPVFIRQLEARRYDIKTFASASLKNPPFERTVFRSLRNLKLETPGNTAYERDCRLTSDWIAYADSVSKQSKREPFFGFLFYDLPHAYELPKNYKKHFTPAWEYADYMSLNNNTDPTPFYNLYRSCVYYDDSLIGKVIGNLRLNKLLENTVVIITGDHGQEFNENHKNYWGHNGNFTRAQVGVPMVVYWPGKKHNVYKHMTTHYDVVPTLMQGIFSVSNPVGDYSIGKNLLDTDLRPWHIMGSKENFAIMKGNQLITVDYNSSFDITDTSLNQVKDAKLDGKLVNDVLGEVNSFYRKK